MIRGKNFGNFFAISFVIDLLIINLLAFYLPILFKHPILFHSYISITWIAISFYSTIYKVNVFTKLSDLIKLILVQFGFFFLVLFAFIGLFKEPNISRLNLMMFFITTLFTISAFKVLVFFLLKEIRFQIKGGIRNIIIIGKNKKTDQLIELLERRRDFGFMVKKQFSPKSEEFKISDCFQFVLENGIDEIYCSTAEINDQQISELVDFSDNNLKSLKFIPDIKNIFSKKLTFEYYDYIPVLSLRAIPLHNPINSFFKRMFDIVFSSFIILGLLSWLIPILAIIIRFESKGPIFFRQKRTGIDNKEFFCYKLRSMRPNAESDDKWATKNDSRVTRVGKFIRRTSIDELPQFYNVLFGTMSIVGPRPHPLKLTDDLSKRIDKFMVRHFIKPGITGLAQIKGERGEIENNNDGLNRLRFDIFYVENWSLFLDLKIILQTILNIFKGEDKAY